MRTCSVFVALAVSSACLQMTSAATWSENLVVPRGESLTLGTEYIGKTNLSMSVSGTLTLSFNDVVKALYVLPTTDPAVLPTTNARTTVDVGPNAGDDGVFNINKATLMSWVKEGTCLADLVIGRNGGKGNVHFNSTGTQPGRMRIYTVELAANAQTDADTFDVMTIGYDSYAEITYGHVVNKNAKPMRITFENKGTGTSSYGYLGTYGSTPLVRLPVAGSDVILKGVANAPIYLKSWYQYGGPMLFDVSENGKYLKACLRTEGDCDVIIGCGGNGYATYLNATNVVWGHKRDLIFRQGSTSAHGKDIVVSVENALPHGPQTGNVVIKPYAAGATYAQRLRLDKAQQVNGIVFENVCSLTNSTETVVPVTFGGGDGSGVVCGDFTVNKEKFAFSKAGTGTLSVSNATFGAFVATGGVVRVAAKTTATFDTLALTNAQLVIERGATLTVGTLAFDEATVDIQADGALVAANVSRGTAGVLRNVLPATLTTNTVSSLDAGFLSATVPVVKEGAGYAVCRTPANAQSAPLEVRGGILKMGGEVCHNPYWRMIVKKAFVTEKRYTDADYPSFDKTVYLFLGHFGQFACDGSYAAGSTSNGGIGTEATSLAAGAATSKNPLFFWNTQQSWRDVTNQYPSVTKKKNDPIVGGGTAQLNPAVFVAENDSWFNLTDWYDVSAGVSNCKIESWGSCLAFTNQVLKVDDPTTWEVVTWRQKASWAEKGTSSYNLQRAVNVEDQSRPHPRRWVLQSSADGETWTTMDEQTNAFVDLGWQGLKLNAQFNYTFNRHVPYLLKSTQASWAFNTFGPVKVAAGATLDLDDVPEANIAFSGLTVDLTAGAGTLTKFAPAPNGTLALVNPRAEDVSGGGLKHRITLPLTVSKFLSTANLASWKVTLDGVPLSANSKVIVEDGRLVVKTLHGMMLIVR